VEYRFKEIRENFDFKQHEIAKDIGISRGNYANIESETENIKLRTFNTYCNKFNFSMDYVANLSDKFSYSGITKLEKLEKRIISDRLITIENDLNKKGKDIAKELGIAPSTYSDYKNVNKPNLIQTLMVKRLASKHDYSMDWIVGRSEQKFIKK